MAQAKSNQEVMEEEFAYLTGDDFRDAPLSSREIAAGMRLLCNNPIPKEEIEDFLREKKIIR